MSSSEWVWRLTAPCLLRRSEGACEPDHWTLRHPWSVQDTQSRLTALHLRKTQGNTEWSKTSGPIQGNHEKWKYLWELRAWGSARQRGVQRDWTVHTSSEPASISVQERLAWLKGRWGERQTGCEPDYGEPCL